MRVQQSCLAAGAPRLITTSRRAKTSRLERFPNCCTPRSGRAALQRRVEGGSLRQAFRPLQRSGRKAQTSGCGLDADLKVRSTWIHQIWNRSRAWTTEKQERPSDMFKISVCGLLICCCSVLYAEEVTLKNGDRFTGTILKVSDKKLTIRTEHASTVTIDWDAVAGVLIRAANGGDSYRQADCFRRGKRRALGGHGQYHVRDGGCPLIRGFRMSGRAKEVSPAEAGSALKTVDVTRR